MTRDPIGRGSGSPHPLTNGRGRRSRMAHHRGRSTPPSTEAVSIEAGVHRRGWRSRTAVSSTGSPSGVVATPRGGPQSLPFEGRSAGPGRPSWRALDEDIGHIPGIISSIALKKCRKGVERVPKQCRTSVSQGPT
eukprot:7552868-Pyramimonas_sp.AAC.1